MKIAISCIIPEVAKLFPIIQAIIPMNAKNVHIPNPDSPPITTGPGIPPFSLPDSISSSSLAPSVR